jgi:DHA2 family multidrug resistance protein
MRTISGAVGTALATATWDDSTRESRAQLVGKLNDAGGAMARLENAGFSAGQARSAIERMVDAQAATIASNHVFFMAATVLFLAAWLPWLAKRPASRIGAAPPVH